MIKNIAVAGLATLATTAMASALTVQNGWLMTPNGPVAMQGTVTQDPPIVVDATIGTSPNTETVRVGLVQPYQFLMIEEQGEDGHGPFLEGRLEGVHNGLMGHSGVWTPDVTTTVVPRDPVTVIQDYPRSIGQSFKVEFAVDNSGEVFDLGNDFTLSDTTPNVMWSDTVTLYREDAKGATGILKNTGDQAYIGVRLTSTSIGEWPSDYSGPPNGYPMDYAGPPNGYPTQYTGPMNGYPIGYVGPPNGYPDDFNLHSPEQQQVWPDPTQCEVSASGPVDSCIVLVGDQNVWPIAHDGGYPTMEELVGEVTGYAYLDMTRGSLIFNGFGYNLAGSVTTPSANVTPVPLPAGLPLLLAGLGAFAVLRRQSKA